MKTLISLFCVFFLLCMSCQKEEDYIYYGEYTGWQYTYISGIEQVVPARLVVSDNGSGSFKFHRWDSRDINSYSYINDNTYQIFYEVADTPVCNGVKSPRLWQWRGTGKFINNDSIYESGIVYHYTHISSTITTVASSTWNSSYKRIK